MSRDMSNERHVAIERRREERDPRLGRVLVVGSVGARRILSRRFVSSGARRGVEVQLQWFRARVAAKWAPRAR